jgi:hypothetical protein
MRNLSELNLNEGGVPVSRLAPSARVVAEFESQFGITLPTAYLEFLQYANGGHPELDSFEAADPPHSSRWSINRFYHLDDDSNSPASLWMAMRRWRSILGKDALPFAADSGGNQYFLDLTREPPPVKICLHDEEFAIVQLAPTFEAFIDRLSVDPDMI